MKNNISARTQTFFTSLLIFTLHLPFVFANTKPGAAIKPVEVTVGPSTIEKYAAAPVGKKSPTVIYDQLKLNALGLSEEAFDYAIKGYDNLVELGKIEKPDIITIADFTKPSSQKRLFVIDIRNCKTLFNTYVAHGQGSGERYATKFSNAPESLQTSLGFYITSGTYIGKNGYSLKLNGLEAGINDQAGTRAIVMHGATYVSEALIRSQGFIGRSWGCPALPEKLSRPIIDKIKNGSCLFIFGNNKKYITHSKILNS